MSEAGTKLCSAGDILDLIILKGMANVYRKKIVYRAEATHRQGGKAFQSQAGSATFDGLIVMIQRMAGRFPPKQPALS